MNQINREIRDDAERRLERLTKMIYHLKGGVRMHQDHDVSGGLQDKWLGTLMRQREETEQLLQAHREAP